VKVEDADNRGLPKQKLFCKLMRWRFRGLKRAIVDKRWHTQDLTGFMYSEPAAFLVVLVGGLCTFLFSKNTNY
jgi:hypothetical protein